MRARGILFLSLCLGGLILLGARQWQFLERRERLVEVPLLAGSTADYSGSGPASAMAPVGLGIVRDMIRDSQPELANLSSRLAHADQLLLSPIPTEMPSGTDAAGPGQAQSANRHREKVSGGRSGDPQGKTGKPDASDKPAKPDTPNGPVIPDKPDRPDRPDRPDKSGKSHK